MKRFTECEIEFKVLTKYASSKFTSLIDISSHFSTLYLIFHYFISLFIILSRFLSFYLTFHHFISFSHNSFHFFTTHFISQKLIASFNFIAFSKVSHFSKSLFFRNSIFNFKYMIKDKNTNNA